MHVQQNITGTCAHCCAIQKTFAKGVELCICRTCVPFPGHVRQSVSPHVLSLASLFHVRERHSSPVITRNAVRGHTNTRTIQSTHTCMKISTLICHHCAHVGARLKSQCSANLEAGGHAEREVKAMSLVACTAAKPC